MLSSAHTPLALAKATLSQPTSMSFPLHHQLSFELHCAESLLTTSDIVMKPFRTRPAGSEERHRRLCRETTKTTSLGAAADRHTGG